MKPIIRDCYPCDGRGFIVMASTQFRFVCNNCRGSGASPTWELSDGSDIRKRPVSA